MPTENIPKKTTVDDILSPLQPKQAVYTKSPWQESLENQESQENESTLKTPITQNTQSQAAAYEPGTFYQDFFKANYPKLTEADLEKLREKERRRTLFSGLGDVMNAFHQAYAKTRGVTPVAEDVSLTGKMRERYEKLKKEYDTNKAQYANAYMNAVKMDDARKQQDISNILAQRRQDRLDRETKIKEDKAAAYQQYQASVASKNDEMAAYYKAKWEALEAGQSYDNALKAARAAQANAAARLSNVRADAGGFSSTAHGVGGYVVEETKTDSHGRTTTTKKERRPTTGGSSSGSGNSGGLGWGKKKQEEETDW